MSQGLFTWESHVNPGHLSSRTLVVTTSSYVDAGQGGRLLTEHLLDHFPNHIVGHFDADQLIDYRDQRPAITFDRDHFSDFDAPRLTLRELEDATGTSFLLLSGPEPAFQWERLARELDGLIRHAGVDRTVLLQAIPMPMPHTRPLHSTRHASDPQLIPGNQPMFGTMQIPATFPSVLELRLGEAGHDVIGNSVHVPQYLAQIEYPPAAVAMLDALRDTTGLQLSGEQLQQASVVAKHLIASQVEQSEELSEMVSLLEQQYDDFMHRRELESAARDLPSAEEIGAEAEEFLRTIRDDH